MLLAPTFIAAMLLLSSTSEFWIVVAVRVDVGLRGDLLVVDHHASGGDVVVGPLYGVGVRPGQEYARTPGERVQPNPQVVKELVRDHLVADDVSNHGADQGWRPGVKLNSV